MNNNWEYTSPYDTTQTPAEPTPQRTYTPPNYTPTQPRCGGFLRGFSMVVLCGFIGFGGGFLGSKVAGSNDSPTIVYQAPPVDNTSTGDAINTSDYLSVAQVSSKVAPSVVEVTTESVTTNPFFGQYVQDGAGSGVIISQDGYILTNNHVVSGAEQIKITLADKTEYVATLVGSDSKTDIAVLKIEADNLVSAVIGNSDALQVGEVAIAVGNPLGTLGGTVTDGIISALNRDITVNNQTMNLLQTNAAVSPGNSGGGLFNARGELIGIVNAKSSGTDTEGLGFAIPINTAMDISQSLMTSGYVTGRPVMGVQVLAITDIQTAMQYGVQQLGVYIQSVDENGAAAKAGLQAGDLFVSIDGVAISDTSEITSLLEEYSVDDTINIQVIREKQVLTFSLTLQESVPAE